METTEKRWQTERSLKVLKRIDITLLQGKEAGVNGRNLLKKEED